MPEGTSFNSVVLKKTQFLLLISTFDWKWRLHFFESNVLLLLSLDSYPTFIINIIDNFNYISRNYICVLSNFLQNPPTISVFVANLTTSTTNKGRSDGYIRTK